MENSWYHMLGKYLGYPSCCINWFANRTDYELNENQEKLHKNHGFIPCPECAEKLIKSKEGVETLIKNRKAKTSFPIYTDLDALEFRKKFDNEAKQIQGRNIQDNSNNKSKHINRCNSREWEINNINRNS